MWFTRDATGPRLHLELSFIDNIMTANITDSALPSASTAVAGTDLEASTLLNHLIRRQNFNLQKVSLKKLEDHLAERYPSISKDTASRENLHNKIPAYWEIMTIQEPKRVKRFEGEKQASPFPSPRTEQKSAELKALNCITIFKFR